MFKPTKKKSSSSTGFKPKQKKKMSVGMNDKKGFSIPHDFKIGQKVKISAEHRAQYLSYRNPDGTLNNPTYEILSFHPYGGVLIMELSNPNMKCLVGYMHLILKEKKG